MMCHYVSPHILHFSHHIYSTLHTVLNVCFCAAHISAFVHIFMPLPLIYSHQSPVSVLALANRLYVFFLPRYCVCLWVQVCLHLLFKLFALVQLTILMAPYCFIWFNYDSILVFTTITTTIKWTKWQNHLHTGKHVSGIYSFFLRNRIVEMLDENINAISPALYYLISNPQNDLIKYITNHYFGQSNRLILFLKCLSLYQTIKALLLLLFTIVLVLSVPGDIIDLSRNCLLEMLELQRVYGRS